MAEYVPDSQGMHNVAPGVDEYVLGGQGSHLSPLLTVPAGHGFMQPLAVMTRFPSHVHDGTAANLPVLQADAGTGPLGHTGWQIDPDGR